MMFNVQNQWICCLQAFKYSSLKPPAIY